MNNNKNKLSFLLALVVILSFVNVKAPDGLFDVNRVAWDEPEKDLPAKKPEEPVVVKKPKTFWETLQGLARKKPKKVVDTDEPFVGPGRSPSVEVAGSPVDGPDDVQDTAAEKAAILRAANRGFTFFRRPTLKGETLTKSQKKLLESLIAKCESNPNYVLKQSDMYDFSKDDLKLVEKIFNTAKEQAARNKKAAQPELTKFKKQQFEGLSKLEAKILKLLLADPAHQPTSFNNVGIAAYKVDVKKLVAAEARINLSPRPFYRYAKNSQQAANLYLDDLENIYRDDFYAQQVLKILRKNPKVLEVFYKQKTVVVGDGSQVAEEAGDSSVQGVKDGTGNDEEQNSFSSDENKKLTQLKENEFKGLSKVEVEILTRLLADPANQPTSLDDQGIEAYKKRIQALVAAEKEIILNVANHQYH